MGQLKSSRATNSDFVGQTDDFFRELEQDVAEILGLTLDVNVSSPIFRDQTSVDGGTNTPSSTVNADGTISGILSFLSISTSAQAAAGVEFEAVGGERYKICATVDDLEVWQWNVGTEQWDLLGSIATGVTSFIGLSDTPADYTSASVGDVVVVNAAKDGLEFSPHGGIPVNLEDLDDVDAYEGNAGKFLSLSTNEPLPTPVWTAVSPGSGVGNFVELGDVDSGFTVDSAGQQFVPEVHNAGTIASPSWKLTGYPQTYIYAVALGMGSDTAIDPPLQRWQVNSGFRRIYWGIPSDPASYEIGNISQQCVINEGDGNNDIIKIPGAYPGFWLFDIQFTFDFGSLSNFLWLEMLKDAGGTNFVIPREWEHMTPPAYMDADGTWHYYTPPDGGTGWLRGRFFAKVHQQKDSGGGQEAKFHFRIKLPELGSGYCTLSSCNLIGYRMR